jgi:hypothetical protein
MRVRSNQFTHDSKTKTFSAFASDFGAFCMSRLYNDACDEGIFVVSEKTGATVKFYLSHTETDGEGDLLAWHLCVCDDEVRRNGRLLGYTIVIFND